MIKNRSFPALPSTLLLIVSMAAIFASACAPETAQPNPTSTILVPILEDTAQAASGPTEAPIASPSPVATSRGPDLRATDPATVSLASGGLQLVEFFRFT